jgi:dephospho-CoA kinase
MTEDDLDRILARQMPSAEKTAQADYVIVTDTTEHARAQVRAVVDDIRRRRADA